MNRYGNKLIIVFVITAYSCGSNKNINSSISSDLVNHLVGYWISANSEYQQDKENEATILYYGPIDKNKEGVYQQGEKKIKYRVVDTYEYYNKIVISIYFSNGREKIETLTLSNDFTRIKNNLVTPDNYSIDTYYIKKNE